MKALSIIIISRSTPERSNRFSNSRPSSRTEILMENKKPSYIDNLNLDDQKRRLSEAGVNRRPSAAHVLTEGKLTVWLKYEVFLDVFDDDEDEDD